MMISRIKNFLFDLFAKRAVIYELTKRDFQQKYMGSYLGFVWVFLQPLAYIIVIYTIFTLGFRAGISGDLPFVLYLICGMIAWMSFAGTLSETTMVIRGHAYLVKKVDFRLSILPLVKVLSSLVPHLFFVCVAGLIAWFHGYPPTIYTFQVFYYMFSMVVLLVGLGWMTSSTSLFVPDVRKIVAIVVQFGFWLSPIFWNISMVPLKYQWIVKLNPFFYIIQGYRESLLMRIPFWQHPWNTIYYWFIVSLALLIGITVFGRLRPHFAEVI